MIFSTIAQKKYTEKLLLTHCAHYGTDFPFIQELIGAGFPVLQDKYIIDRYWIPNWILHLYIELIGWGPHNSESSQPMSLRIKCVKHIYDDEDLRAKYSTLYTLDPDYRPGITLGKDLEHLDCFKKLVSP